VLCFPLRPAAAAPALQRSPAGGLAALVLPLVLAAFLLARGARAADAAAAGAALLLLEAGLGLGGAAGTLAARLLLQAGGLPRPAAPSLVFAAWALLLFLLTALLAAWLGAGAAAPLFAGMAVLVWGVMAGMGFVAGGAEVEQGRALVASCVGAAGAVLGVLGAGLLVQATLVVAVPAPAAAASFAAGDLLLVRRESGPAPGTLVVVVDPGTREAFLARVRHLGSYEPVGGDAAAWGRGRWTPLGRVFFHFGGAGGAGAVAAASP